MHQRTVAFLALWLACLLLPWRGAAADLPKGILQLDAREAPPLQLTDLDGADWNLEDARGRWVFVHFWATWCGPCRREMPTIQSIVSRFDPERLSFAVVNTAESEDTVFMFLAAVAPDIVPLMDSDGLATERWQPRGLPATYFVDPGGRLRYLALGGRPWDEPEYLNFIEGLVSP